MAPDFLLHLSNNSVALDYRSFANRKQWHRLGEIPLEEPEMLFLTLDRGQSNSIDNSLQFFAEKGKMNITSKLKTFYTAAKITGSKNQELFEEFNSFNSKFNDDCDFEKFGKFRAGKIGLQDHNDMVSFRNIKIRKL